MKALSKDQIQSLYKFTKAHYVEWYDLQTELVDHLANDIEHIWQENPELDFYQARDKSFKKFGVFGFSDIVEKKYNTLNKKYWRLVWHYFKVYFTWPKIMFTLMLMAIIYTVFDWITFKTTASYIAIITVVLIPLVFTVKRLRTIRKREKLTGRKWMFERTMGRMGELYLILQIPFQSIYHIENIVWNTYTQLLFAVLLSLSAIFFYVILKIIPPQLEKEMSLQFPEYRSALAS